MATSKKNTPKKVETTQVASAPVAEAVAGRKMLTDKLSIYIPANKLEAKPVERLVSLGAKRDRSVNFLVVEAILQYLDKEEKS